MAIMTRNPTLIIPIGPEPGFNTPHDRIDLAASPSPF